MSERHDVDLAIVESKDDVVGEALENEPTPARQGGAAIRRVDDILDGGIEREHDVVA
jgi:hypothetical protein